MTFAPLEKDSISQIDTFGGTEKKIRKNLASSFQEIFSFLLDGEHFFLEPEEKLAKFAPPGWRTAKDVGRTKPPYYTLYYRLKFYPVTMDFIK